jgi:TonB family protein
LELIDEYLCLYASCLLAGLFGRSSVASDWEWNTGTPICALRQRISSSGDTVEISRTPANDETEVFIKLPRGSKIREGRFHDSVVTVYPSGSAIGDVSSGAGRDGQPQVHVVTPDPTFIDSFSNASALEVSHGRLAPIRLAIKSPLDATTALRACEDRKMVAWGIDSTSWRALRSHPFPLKPVRDRFDSLDYPQDAMAQHLETDAITRLDVGIDGTVEQCRTLNPGAYRGFEEAACRVLKGARFRPAIDSAGAPVAAPILYDVKFRLAE